jgi:AcrR family transcriptional regulator
MHWVQPQQDRSQRTLQALLDAAEALLAEGRAFDEVSVAELAAHAGVSVGAFYGRFKTKADLLRALYARYKATSETTLAAWADPEALGDAPLAEVVAGLCTFLVHDYAARAGLRRALALGVQSDPVVHDLAATLTGRTVDAFATLLAARPDAWHGDDPELAADLVHRVLFGTLEHGLLAGDAAGPPRPPEVVATHLSRAVCGVLGVP